MLRVLTSCVVLLSTSTSTAGPVGPEHADGPAQLLCFLTVLGLSDSGVIAGGAAAVEDHSRWGAGAGPRENWQAQ